MWYIYIQQNIIQCFIKEEENSDTCNNIESWCYIKWKKEVTKNIVSFYLLEIPKSSQIHKDRVLFGENLKVLEIDSGNDYRVMWIDLMT